MFLRLLTCVALCGLVPWASTARPADDTAPGTPGIILRVQSLGQLMSNFRHLATVVGREEEAKQLEGILQAKAGGPKGLEGIDHKRPMAAYVIFGKGGLANTTAVGLIPIADEKAFLGLIENLGVKAEKEKDDVYLVTGEALKVPVYFRFANRHAYVTALNKHAIDRDRLLAPAEVLPADRGEVLSLTLRIDGIPRVVRDLAIAQVELQLDGAIEEKKEGESKAERTARIEFLDMIKRRVVSVLRDGRELALRAELDQGKQELSLDLVVNAQKGSPLAEDIARLGRQKSVVAGLVGHESVMNFVVNLPQEKQFAEALQAVLKERIEKDIAKESHREKRERAERMFKAFAPALKFTDADVAIDFRGPHKDGKYTVVAGTRVADGAVLDRSLRDIIKELPEKERGQFKLDAEKAGALSVHRVAPPADDAGYRKVFGDEPAYFAVRADAAFVAAGPGALRALTDALKTAPTAGKPVQLELSMGRLAQAMAKEKPKAPEAAAKAFAQGSDSDKIRLVIEGGAELKLRAVVKTPVLRFLHLMEPDVEE
jgi:hypothetical protein